MNYIPIVNKCYYCEKFIKSMRLEKDIAYIYGYFVEGKYYVGQSMHRNLTTRHNQHLNRNKQKIDKVLKNTNDYIFFIICFCRKNERLNLETYWIEMYHSYEGGWNQSPGGEAGDSIPSPLLSAYWKKRYKDGYISPRIGCKHSQETKDKIGELASIRYKGSGNPMWENGKPVVCFTKDGELVKIYYGGTRQAERETGIAHTHISSVCSNKPHCHTIGGYVWKYLKDCPELQ